MASQAKGWEGGSHPPKHLLHGKYGFGNTNELGKMVLCPVLQWGLTQDEAVFSLSWFLPRIAFQ